MANFLILNRPVMVFLLAATLVTGCARERPVYEVENRPIPLPSASLTADQIGDRIIKAGQTKNWRITKSAPGQLLGYYSWKRHSAIVAIDYSRSFFSIRYKSSVKLLAHKASDDEAYSGKFVIHRRYNQFVRQLESAIDHELSLPAS